MNAAQYARLNREAHPELYCTKCFWRVQSRKGYTPCPKHPVPSRVADYPAPVPLGAEEPTERAS
jgi:hypothetical protein